MTKGSCLCGAVQLEIFGTPWALTYCHCSRCRKAAGVFSAILTGPVDDLTIVSGEDAIARFCSDAFPKHKRAFCRHCGTSLGVLATEDGIYGVAASVLDDDPAIKPNMHFHTASKPHWYEIDDNLEQYEHGPIPQG